jgi:hypothetical protein
MCIVRHKRVYLKIPNIGECRYRKLLETQHGSLIAWSRMFMTSITLPSTVLYLHSPILGILR